MDSGLAGKFEKVSVICLEQGEHQLPKNVSVYSLGKESGASRLTYLVRFYRHIITLRKEYDCVLVHMNPEYVALGGLVWRALHKRVVLWYAHKSVTPWLHLAEKFAHVVVSASKESFRLPSRKTQFIGHGIDVTLFSPEKRPLGADFRIVSVGRISPVKDYETLIAALALLANERIQFHALIVGGPGQPDNEQYALRLKKIVQDSGLTDAVRFTGPVPHGETVAYYRQASVCVNLSRTGSMDKAVLESMACAVPAITSNEAFVPLLSSHKELLLAVPQDARDLAEKLKRLHAMKLGELQAIGDALRAKVKSSHSLARLLENLTTTLTSRV